MDLKRMSKKLIMIVDELLSNQEIVNLIGSNSNLPLLEDVNPSTIAPMSKNERITVTPFDDSYTDDVRSEIRVYYPEFTFENNNHVNNSLLIIDVVVHNNIWLMEVNGEKVVRPLHIVSEIFDHFKSKQRRGELKNLGRIQFTDASYVLVNKEFNGIRLFGRLLDF